MATNQPNPKAQQAAQAAANEIDTAEVIMAKAKANKKLIVVTSICVAALIVIALAWFFINKSQSNKATQAAATADMTLLKGDADADSLALPLYLKAADLGHDSGNRAKVMAGILLYQKKDYQGALKQFKSASVSGEVIPAGVLIAQGNCYANLGELDNAAKAFKKAAEEADGNAAIAPFALVKLANIYHAQQKYADEAKCYKEILEDYPQYAANEYVDNNPNDPAASNYNDGANRDIQKYYERAKALAGK